MPNRKKRTNKANQGKKNASKLQEYVGKYDVVSKLANTNFGLTFGQLLRGDVDGATKVMQRLLGKKNMPRGAVVSDLGPRLLRFVQVKVYGTEVWALLDSGAVPDVMSAELSR